MYSKRNDLNCEIALREYVTTTRQPKWPNQGLRDIFQSPMITIPPTATEVPVRCSTRGVDVNTVKYIHKRDIEFSEDVYQRMNVSQEPKIQNAHGVVVVDATIAENQQMFEYKRGDRLWLYIDSAMTQRKETVRVINLRTFEYGDISLQHVCWYPNYQNRSDEFWTIGGASSSSTHHCWGIGQKVDCGKSYSGIIHLPRKSRIPVAQARSLFRRRLGVVESLLKNKLEQSNKRRIGSVQKYLAVDGENHETVAGHATESVMGLQYLNYPRGDASSTSSNFCKRRRLDLSGRPSLIQSASPGCVFDSAISNPLFFPTTPKVLEIDGGNEGAIDSVTCNLYRARLTETTTFDITDPSIEADPTAIAKARGPEFPSFVSSATKDDDPIWEDIFASMKVCIKVFPSVLPPQRSYRSSFLHNTDTLVPPRLGFTLSWRFSRFSYNFIARLPKLHG
jgi:hypothetical protein